MEHPHWLFGESTAGFLKNYLDILAAPTSKGSALATLKRKHFIAMTSRTGSTLLCDELVRFGLLAGEYFNTARIARLKESLGLRDYGELCAHYASESAPNGTFAVKGTIQMLMPLFLVGEFPASLPQWKFVYMSRQNVVLQAISIVIATKSGTWLSRVKPSHQITDADYSAAEISAQMRSIFRGRAWLELFFAGYGITPLRLSFEELTDDRAGTVDRVVKHLGLAPDEEFARAHPREPLKSQMTDLNAEWERRFRRDIASLGS